MSASRAEERRPLDPNVVTLGQASLLNDLSSEIIFPLLPAFLSTLGAGPAVLGLIEGAADSASSLLRLASGALSDRLGRRKALVVVGYGLASFARPLIAVATSPAHVLAVRLSDRVGKGIRSAPRDALIADSTPAASRGRAFGFHRAMDHVGAIVAPLLATPIFYALGRDYRRLFLLAAIPGILCVVLVAARVREVRPRTTEGAPLLVLSLAGLDPRFLGFLVAVLVFTLGNSTDAFLLLALEASGIDVALLPLLWSALHAVKAASVYACGAFSDRVGRRALILAGWSWYAIIYLGFALFADSPGALVVLFLAYGLFFGLTEGTERALVGDLVPEARRGAAYGLYHAAIGIAALPSSLLMGWIWQSFGRAAAFEWAAAVAGLAALLLIALVRGPDARRSPA